MSGSNYREPCGKQTEVIQTANTTVRLKAMPFQSEHLNEFFRNL